MRGKKCKAALALALTIALATPAATVSTPVTEAEAAAKVQLNIRKPKTLEVGKTFTLKLKNAKGKVKWKSYHKAVATISATGKVKGIKEGVAAIIATNRNKKYKCKIRVVNPTMPDGTKEVKVGPVKLRYPGNFTSDYTVMNGNYMWVGADSDGTVSMKQALTVKMQYTGEEAYDYDTLLGMYEALLSEETQKSNYEALGAKAEITDYELSSYDSKLGKAIRVAFHLNLETEGKKMEEDFVVYLIGIKNYIIEVDGEAINGGKIDTVDGYAKALLDTMTVL